MCSLIKLPIRPLFLFKSSSRKFSIISSPNTRNAGLVHFARNNGYGIKEYNEFSRYTEKYNKKRKFPDPDHIEPHAPNLQLGNGDDDTDSYSKNSTLSHVDSLLILRRHREVQGAFDLVKATLLPILLQKLKNVQLEDVTVKSGLETAASIDLLRLFGASNCNLDEIGRSALQGARLLEEGHKKVNTGEGMLMRAFDEIPSHLE